MLAYEWTFGSVLWAMVVFFFWFMLIWIFIGVFADLFRRNDHTGWAKAGFGRWRSVPQQERRCTQR